MCWLEAQQNPDCAAIVKAASGTVSSRTQHSCCGDTMAAVRRLDRQVLALDLGRPCTCLIRRASLLPSGRLASHAGAVNTLSQVSSSTGPQTLHSLAALPYSYLGPPRLPHQHRPPHLDLVGCLKAVQLVQQLQHGALHLTVPATTPATAALSSTADGVDLVHENDRGGVLPAGMLE